MISRKILIDKAKGLALKNKPLERDLLISLLEISEREEFEYLASAAREVAKIKAENKAYIWGAVGIDFVPCKMNCEFCSMGEKWNVIKEKRVLTYEQIRQSVKRYSESNARWIVLRTTEFYPLDELINLARRLRSDVDGSYELGLNTGELTDENAEKLKASGIDFMYHSLRLGEGVTTKFRREDRLKTLSVVSNSDLDLVFLAEPIGEEHSPSDIADIIEVINGFKVSVSGAMARIPVENTPLFSRGIISSQKLATITAVTRLGVLSRDICSHPPLNECVMAGSNVLVVESGSVPRGSSFCDNLFGGFTPEDAKAMFLKNGYSI